MTSVRNWFVVLLIFLNGCGTSDRPLSPERMSDLLTPSRLSVAGVSYGDSADVEADHSDVRRLLSALLPVSSIRAERVSDSGCDVRIVFQSGKTPLTVLVRMPSDESMEMVYQIDGWVHIGGSKTQFDEALEMVKKRTRRGG